MKLSKNFQLSEFTRSQTASKHNIKNEPSQVEIENLRALCLNVLQPLREYIGKPIKINSGYRCEELNKKIGGSKTSSHKKGEASDIECDNDKENVNLFLYIIETLDFDQAIIYKSTKGEPRFVHVSYREGSNRNQAMIKRDGGGYELTDSEKIKKEF
jgi:hypothetical protein